MIRRAATTLGRVLPETVKEIVRPFYFDALAQFGTENIRPPRERLMIAPSGVCNLGCKFCAYRHKTRQKQIMSNERFFGLVDQATQIGYSRIGLTPITGEVYTDPDILTKLSFLEEHPGVETYYFFTNLTLPSTEDLRETLTDCEKMTNDPNSLFVSIYGHDKDSFLKITGGESRHYEQLVRNLAFLGDFLTDPDKITIEFRTFHSVDPLKRIEEGLPPDNALLQAVEDLQEKGVAVGSYDQSYNNWGGVVSEDDVDGLDLEIEDQPSKKRGACQLIFNKQIILPDGTVNACACRDVDATLWLGNTSERPLAEILSPSANDRYRQLIERQMANDFPAVCETCDFYESVNTSPGQDDSIDLTEFYQNHDPMSDPAVQIE